MANPPKAEAADHAAALEPTAQADRHAALPPEGRLILTRTPEPTAEADRRHGRPGRRRLEPPCHSATSAPAVTASVTHQADVQSANASTNAGAGGGEARQPLEATTPGGVGWWSSPFGLTRFASTAGTPGARTTRSPETTSSLAPTAARTRSTTSRFAVESATDGAARRCDDRRAVFFRCASRDPQPRHL
jgi:hypothetical protein